jgi:hypothetical protein
MSRLSAASDIFSGLADTDGEKSKMFGFGGLSNLDPRASSALDMCVTALRYMRYLFSHTPVPDVKPYFAGTLPVAFGA